MKEINKTQTEIDGNSAQAEVPATSKKDKKNKSSNKVNLDKKDIEATTEKIAEKTTDAKETQQVGFETMTTEHRTTTNNTQYKEKRSGFGLSLLAIALVVALGGTGYHFGLLESNKLTAKIDSLNRELTSLKGELNQSNANNSAAFSSSKQERDKLQILLDQQNNSLSSMQIALIDLKGRRPNDWLLAEADHLIKQAGRQLWIEKDIQTATRLIETADQRVAQLNDPSLMPIRQALANDIQRLKSIVTVDSDGIILRVTSLQNQVNSLVLANALKETEFEELEPKEVSEEISNWKENLVTSMKDFADQFITYRKREGSVVPLLTPAQTFYLQENIKAKLASAINAVYRENIELYLGSLATAKQWIKDFYHLELPETIAFIQSIEELEKTNIKVQYPSKLTSLDLISNELSQRLSKDLSSLVSNEVKND